MPRKKKRPKLNLPPHVVIKAGKWHVRRVFPSQERDAKGRIKYVQITRRCEPETAARAAEVSAFIENEVKGLSRPQATETLREFMETFLAAKKANVTRRTLEFYEYIYDHHIKNSRIADMKLVDIQPMHMQLFYTGLGVSPSRSHKVHILLSMAFRQAHIWRLIDRDPSTGVLLPKYVPTKTGAFTEAEAKLIARTAQTDLKYLIVLFTLETGLRPQEVVVLRWSDLDLEKNTVSVTRAIEQKLKGGGHRIKEVKTAASEGTVSFSHTMKLLLVEQKRILEAKKLDNLSKSNRKLETHKKIEGVNYQKRIRAQREAARIADNLSTLDLVFPNADGGYLSIGNVNRALVKELIRKAGLDETKYSFKSLRHSCASILAKYLHPDELRRRMRHRDARTTFGFYVHAEDSARQKASEKMSDALYSSD